MTRVKSIGKSILIGGTAAGVISLIPIVNFLNLPLMLWMGFGGGLCVYLLVRENRDPPVPALEASLSGALGGVLGWVIFAAVSFLLIANISPGKMEKIISFIEMLSPSSGEDMAEFFQGNEWQRLFFAVMGIALVFSVISGVLGGIIARGMFQKQDRERRKKNKNL